MDFVIVQLQTKKRPPSGVALYKRQTSNVIRQFSKSFDKNSIDARLSTVKNYVLISGYSTFGIHGTKKKEIQSHPTITEKNIYFRFCLQDYCMGLRKNSIDTCPPPNKNSFLTTVLLWYMGLKKNTIGIWLLPKK